jgi:putative membrane protein insertion efficiency factor
MIDPHHDSKSVNRFLVVLSSSVHWLIKTTSRAIVVCLLVLVRAYQLMISPFTRPRCRFQPTCSEYARQALDEHGLAQGLWLSAKRIGRCHPLSDGGVDLVPMSQTDTPSQASNKP